MLSDTRQPCDEGVLRSTPDVRDCGQAVGRWVLTAAILGSSISFIDGTVVNVALPVLQQELGASVGEAQWVIESYALMLSALILVGGSMGDRYGRKRIFAIGVLIFGVASVLCGLAMNAEQLIAARTVQGIGAAMLVPGSLALISANFSKERRGRAIGTWSGVTAIAAGIGPVLGGWLVENFSWRWIFFINIPLAVAVLLVVRLYVPESRDDDAHGSLDWPGATLATIGLGAIVLGLIESNTYGLGSAFVIVNIVIGIAALVAFVFVEARRKDPMMPLHLFSSPAFAGANLLTLFLYAGLGGVLFFLPFNLIQIQGYSPTAAGAALVPFVLILFLLGRWAGGLIDRYGSKLPLIVGPLISAAGFALYAWPGSNAGSYWTSFFPAVFIMSIGMAIVVAPLTTTVMGAVGERHAGIASGVSNAVSRAAGLIAVAAFGVVLLSAFDSGLSKRLESSQVRPEIHQKLVQNGSDFASIKIPDDATSEERTLIESAIGDSFVDGFRWVAYLSAALAIASAIAAWWMIPGKMPS
jgi:EmrB/QacA subfamily drug resistance transporter